MFSLSDSRNNGSYANVESWAVSIGLLFHSKFCLMNWVVAIETTHPVRADTYCRVIASSRTPITVTPTRINNQPHPLIEMSVNSTTVGWAIFNTTPVIRRPAPMASGSSLISCYNFHIQSTIRLFILSFGQAHGDYNPDCQEIIKARRFLYLDVDKPGFGEDMTVSGQGHHG